MEEKKGKKMEMKKLGICGTGGGHWFFTDNARTQFDAMEQIFRSAIPYCSKKLRFGALVLLLYAQYPKCKGGKSASGTILRNPARVVDEKTPGLQLYTFVRGIGCRTLTWEW